MKKLTSTTLFFFCTILCFAQLSQLSDEFDDASTLSNWLDVTDTEGWGSAQHLEVHNIDTDVPDQLLMIPYTTGWYQNLRSVLLYKMVNGDFVFTTEVRATNRAQTDMPGGQYSLTGVMIRTPAAYAPDALNNWQQGQENYIFHSLGFASLNHPSCNGCPGPHFEIKTTINSNSTLQVSTAPSSHLQIRMARVGDAVILLYAEPGETFQIRNRYCREDFPEDMQLGLVAYTDWGRVGMYNTNASDRFFANSNVLTDGVENDPFEGASPGFNPDLRAEFEFARFEDVNIPAELQGSNFCNPAEVSDADILSFLSYESQATALALELIDLKATPRNKQIELTWTSGNGTTPKSFIIEHRTPKTDFETIATLSPNETPEYSFLHQNPQNGINFYRIKQKDYDDRSSLSKVVAAQILLNNSITVFPNPNNGQFQIRAENSFKGQIGIILDVYGKAVHTTTLFGNAPELALEHLPKGVYFLKIDNEVVERIVLQ